LSFDTLARLPIPAERALAAVQALTRASGSNGLVAGETIDILSEGRAVSPETLESIHALKTGALIAASCEIGVLVSGGTSEDAKLLRAYGEDIGLAFQIADDVLNETSTPEELGKAAGSDRARMKATYPGLYGLEESRRRALEAAERGISRLSALPNRRYLEELARFSVERLS